MHSSSTLSYRLYLFLLGQVEGIHQRGFSAIGHKTLMILGLAAAVPLVLLVRAIRPIIHIRFTGLGAGKIGDVTPKVEFYLCEREAGVHPKSLDLFYYFSPVCNNQLGRMIERNLRVFKWVSYLDRVNRFIPFGVQHVIKITGGSNWDETGLMPLWPIHLGLNRDEERLGQEALQRIGIPDGAAFVCFHVRDSAYMNSVAPGFDWSYHDFRKSKLQDYIPALEELTQRGYYVVRMGSAVNERLRTTNPMIIDYASNHRTDFLDIYLFWRCRFYLGSSAGIWALPAVFRKPIAYVNSVPVQVRNSRGPNDLFMPKKLWLRHEQRYMTFREISDPGSGVGWFVRSEQYESLGIELIENTPEEITALTLEMDQRLGGTWQTTEEDEELQGRFWSVTKLEQPNGLGVPRMGAQFLRENRDLLD